MKIRFALQINDHGIDTAASISWQHIVNIILLPVLVVAVVINFMHSYRVSIFQHYAALMVPTAIACALMIAETIGAGKLQEAPGYLIPSGLCILAGLMFLVFTFKPKLIVS